MSGLLAALQRLEGSPPPAAPSVARLPSASPIESAPRHECHDLATKLLSACPPPSIVAVVGIGVEEPWSPLLRETADAIARRIGRDVVLLGPGLLDDGPRLTAQWSSLRERAGFGLLHAPVEYAAGRLDGLGRVDAVVAIVERGRTSERAVQAFLRLLQGRGLAMRGAIVVGD